MTGVSYAKTRCITALHWAGILLLRACDCHLASLGTDDMLGRVLPADSLDGSSNERGICQYEKWSPEEEQIFFLKLPTVCTMNLAECFKCIAQHLPNKQRDQVIRSLFHWLHHRLIQQVGQLADEAGDCVFAGQVVLLPAQRAVSEAQSR